MKKILISAILCVFLFTSTASAQISGSTGSISYPNYLKKVGSALLPVVATYELGSTTTRWAKGWFDDIDTTIATIGSVVSGALTITVDDANALLVETAGGTDVFNVATDTPLITLGANIVKTAGILGLGGVGGSNNEDITLDFETTANQVDVGTTTGVTDMKFADLSILAGAYEFAEDAGFVAAMDMSVSSTPSAGDQMSYTFKIDGNSFLKIFAEADGSGGIQNEEVRVFQDTAFSGDTNTIGGTDIADKLLVEQADGTDLFQIDSSTPVMSTRMSHNVYNQETHLANLTMQDARVLYFGSADDSGVYYNAVQTPDTVFWGLSADSNAIVFAEKGDSGYDFAHGLQTNPTIFGQSANQSATEWWSLTHDQTDFLLSAGAGDIRFNDGIAVERSSTAAAVNTAGETIVGVTDTSAPRTITLDTDDVKDGHIIIVKDESGGAAANNITIDTEGAETIDGAASITITANYGVARIYSDGTNWFTI